MDDTRKQSLARLLEAAAVKNVHGPAAVARGLNVSDQTINNWKSRGVPHAKTIEAQTLWGVSAHWISTGEGDTWVADLPNRNQGTPVKSLSDEQEHEEPAVHVPLLRNSGSMGPGTDVEHDDVIVGTIALSPDWISKRFSRNYTFCLTLNYTFCIVHPSQHTNRETPQGQATRP